VGGFDRMRADLRKSSPAPAQSAQRLGQAGNQNGRGQDNRGQDSGQFDVRVDQPSSRFQKFEQKNGLFTIEHPDNWRAYASDSGYAVSIAPDGGVVDTANGQAMLYGVIVNHYAPFQGDSERQSASRERSYAPYEDSARWRGSLADATDDLVRQVIQSNSYLRAQDGQARREQVDGQPSYSVALSGRSPVTGQDERVTVVTRSLPDGHVLYALCIVPGGSDYNSMAGTFTHMLRTLIVNDEAAHRAVTQTPTRLTSRR
jgi:hypothetical protein